MVSDSLQEPCTSLTCLAETHIDDVAAAFILLIEEALKPNGGKAQWGDNGYYFAAGHQFVSTKTIDI